MRPHLFITAADVDGLLSVEALARAVSEDAHAAALWQQLRQRVDAALQTPPYLPGTALPGRGSDHVMRENRDYTICSAARERILGGALLHLLTGKTAYMADVLRQIETLLDPQLWPDWRDLAHLGAPVDLRHGQLAPALALAVDWLHPSLDAAQRRWLVDGIVARAFQPFWASVEAGAWWVNGHTNWTTCIVGGIGIAAMALAEDYADSEALVAFSLSRMTAYLESYGADGEFNESVGYAGATRLAVDYFNALRYATSGRDNRLAAWPFPQTAAWYAHLILPPGRAAAFGDAHPDDPAATDYFATLAAATGDGVLQWLYLNTRVPSSSRQSPLACLLGYDARVEPVSPQGRWPLGRACAAHGRVISSRTDWDFDRTPCVVYGKAGIERNHQHHDAGQVCIDGYGERLIVDLGAPSLYPADFFHPDRRYSYYIASWTGHNVVTIDDLEMAGPPGSSGELAATFDETGSRWQMDLTALYPGALLMRRQVVHLLPATVAVLDELEQEAARPVTLRWHTRHDCQPAADGRFTVVAGAVRLSALVVCLEGPAAIAAGRHAWSPPFDRSRLGLPLSQRHEPYVSARCCLRRCRFLTLFNVFPPGADSNDWQSTPAGWQLQTATGPVQVRAGEASGSLIVESLNSC